MAALNSFAHDTYLGVEQEVSHFVLEIFVKNIFDMICP